MSAYPNQPQSRGGWPEPPSPYAPDQGDFRRPRRRPRRRRRGRGWIALLIVIVVLGGLFIAADQFARSYAQNTIASRAQSSGFPAKPSVSIKGFPFLTQVAARDIDTIDLHADNTTVNGLDIASINAVASGAHLNSSYKGATVDTVTGTAVVPFSSVLSSIGAPSGVTLSADPAAGPNVAKVGIGPVSTEADVTQTGSTAITIRLRSTGDLPLSAFGGNTAYTFRVPQLPFGIALNGVSVTGQGISVQGSAHNVTLGQ